MSPFSLGFYQKYLIDYKVGLEGEKMDFLVMASKFSSIPVFRSPLLLSAPLVHVL